MATAQKKVVVRMSGGGVAWGYLPQEDFLTGISGSPDEDVVELIEVDARARSIHFNKIEMIAYVKNFNLNDPLEPERLGKRSFTVRPKSEGIWVRLEFRELAPLEGLVRMDLSFLDTILDLRGLFLTPPDGRSNALRVFVPRHAVRSLEVLGWVSSPSRKLAEKAARRVELALQAGLFEGND